MAIWKKMKRQAMMWKIVFITRVLFVQIIVRASERMARKTCEIWEQYLIYNLLNDVRNKHIFFIVFFKYVFLWHFRVLCVMFGYNLFRFYSFGMAYEWNGCFCWRFCIEYTKYEKYVSAVKTCHIHHSPYHTEPNS